MISFAGRPSSREALMRSRKGFGSLAILRWICLASEVKSTAWMLGAGMASGGVAVFSVFMAKRSFRKLNKVKLVGFLGLELQLDATASAEPEPENSTTDEHG